MKTIALDEKWVFRQGYLDSIGMLESDPGIEVNLPHDGMIGTDVSADAPAASDSGYFCGGLSNYTKMVFIPEDWKDECTGLMIDGAMMNATVDVNGSRVALQHNGYIPFYVDLTEYVTFGSKNRITVNVNTSMQPNSRWYTGSGLYRGVKLLHGPRVHIVPDGIYVYTKEVSGGYAFLEGQVEVENATLNNRIVEVSLYLYPEDSQSTCADVNSLTSPMKCGSSLDSSCDQHPVASVKRVIQIAPSSIGTARLAFYVNDPLLWDTDNPNLYRIRATVTDLGIFRTHLLENDDADKTTDEAETLFGIRTVTADSVRGFLINGQSVKLKGGCLHHDNGLLGSVSLYETESRKVKKLKEIGFNAIRTAHNPPSAALIEACDRIGMYVFDEAFDAWNIGKRGGDYHQFFSSDWEKDISAFVKRDRTHPCVIMWSTGNEIPERGGLAEGYLTADQIAKAIRTLDPTRPISNGICSFWSGLDDELARGQNQEQNSADGLLSTSYEKMTEPFTNGLDIVGYNYLEDIYDRDHKMYPERVILGSENFPKEIGFRWPYVESHPYVIGDFTWTAWDYIGEAGIGKASYTDPGDPKAPKSPWDLMPQVSSPYPWRTANDADYDINGNMLAQGAYRSVVWGSDKTYVYSKHPSTYGQNEVISPWGFPVYVKNWNYGGYEGKPVELIVYSGAEEVEIFINGESISRKTVSSEKPFPKSVCFVTEYRPGTIEAVSYTNGQEISRDKLITSGPAYGIRLIPEKTHMHANGHDLIYVGIEIIDRDGNLVPDAEILLTAKLSANSDKTAAEDTDSSAYAVDTHKSASLAAFGSANPITEENYTDDKAVTYRGRAMAVIRSGYNEGEVTFEVSADGMETASVKFV